MKIHRLVLAGTGLDPFRVHRTSPMKPMQSNERSVSASHEFKHEFGFPLPITLSKLIARDRIPCKFWILMLITISIPAWIWSDYTCTCTQHVPQFEYNWFYSNANGGKLIHQYFAYWPAYKNLGTTLGETDGHRLHRTLDEMKNFSKSFIKTCRSRSD